MRASVDPLRNRAVSLIEAAKDQAEDALLAGEGRLREVIDAGADRATTRVDDVAARVPVVTVTKHAGRSRKRMLLLILLVGVVGVIVWSARRKAQPTTSSEPAPAPTPTD